MPKSILSGRELHELAVSRPGIQRQFGRKLLSAGFSKPEAQALLQITPDSAAAVLEKGGTAQAFFAQVEAAGRQLAMLNVSPEKISSAVEEYGPVKDRFWHAVIRTLNQAYHQLREKEWRALNEWIQTRSDALNTDALVRALLEKIARFSEAEAGHLYFRNARDRQWELHASTAQAPSALTKIRLPENLARIRKLAQPARVDLQALDAGWPGRWPCAWSIPILREKDLAGVIQLAFKSERTLYPREIELLTVTAHRFLPALERTSLLEDILERDASIRSMSRRMLQVEEMERRRISRELHDDAGQSLVVIRLQMEMLEQAMPPEASEWRERLGEARDLTEKTILSIRRLISDLSPAVLEQLGLAAAIRQLVNRFGQSFPGQVWPTIGELPDLPTEFELVVYRLAQECLNNIAKHSYANNVNISLTIDDRVLRLYVEDDGVGFYADGAPEHRRCFGIVGMRERVALLG